MYEHKSTPLVSWSTFVVRQLWHFAAACGIIACALAIGTAGYSYFEGMGLVDSVYSASLILTGMGPSLQVKTVGGKIFVSAYALFSGLVFLSTASVMVVPLLHRMLHKLHVDPSERD